MSSPEWSLMRLVNDGGWIALSRGLSAILGVAAVVLATALLRPEQYGVLALVLMSSSVMYGLSASWTILPTYVHAGQEFGQEGAVGLVARARLRIVLRSLGAVIVLAALTGWVTDVWSALRWPVTLAWLAASLGYLLCEQVTTLAESSGNYKLSIFIQLTRPLTYAIALSLLLWTDTASLDMVLAAMSTSWLFSITMAGIALPKINLRVTGKVKEAGARLLAASRPLFLYSVCQLGMASIDIVLIGIFGSLTDVGHYGLAYQMYATGALLVGSLMPVITPRLARLDAGGEGLRSYVAKASESIYPHAGIALGLLACLAPLGLSVAFDDRYIAAAGPLLILIVALAATVGITVLHPVLVVRGRARLLSSVAALALGLNAVLDLVLLGIFRVGIEGPALATVIAMIVTWTFYARAVAAETGLALRRSGELLFIATTGSVCGLIMSPIASATAGLAIVLSSALGARCLSVTKNCSNAL